MGYAAVMRQEPCLSENRLAEFLGGELSEAGRAEVGCHIDCCDDCRRLLAALAENTPVDCQAVFSPELNTPDYPSEIDEYRLIRLLGQGAMGQVYVAEDTLLGREVAIKLLLAGAPDEAARQRFWRGARAIARLQHPNVVTVHRVGESKGRPYLVSEMVRGQSLDRLSRPLPWQQVRSIGVDLARGLAAAHQQGVLHRDIKPANAILAESGEAKLLDFGLAKLLNEGRKSMGAMGAAELDSDGGMSVEGAMIGTPLYLAPELWRREPATRRSDVYALGVLLYELCAARLPHTATKLLALREKVLSSPPLRLADLVPNIDVTFSAVVDRCLHQDPSQRFSSGEELYSALVTALAPRVQHRLRWIAALVLPLLALLPAEHFVRARDPSDKPAELRRSVAVLGFKNLSSTPERAWISTALSEMLRTELAAGGNLRLVPGEHVARVKWDLHLSDTDGYEAETLHRLASALRADVVVLGSYLALKDDAELRIDLRLQDTKTGESMVDIVRERDLFAVVERSGRRLRERLGITVPTSGSYAGRPATVEAARRYAEGIDRLRRLDYRGAQQTLDLATRADSENPLTYQALASAWEGLGEQRLQQETAQRAVELASLLREEDRLMIEAYSYRAVQNFDKAAAVHRKLFERYSDSLDYGIELMHDLMWGRRHAEAEEVLVKLRQMPGAEYDFRIAWEEEWLREEQGDVQTALQISQRQLEKMRTSGFRGTWAMFRFREGRMLEESGRLREARVVLDDARSVLAETGSKFDLTWNLLTLSDLHFEQGSLDLSLSRLQEAMELAQEQGHTFNLLQSLRYGVETLLLAGDIAAARQRLQEAEAVSRSSQALQAYFAPVSQLARGRIELVAGHLRTAQLALEDARKRCSIGNRSLATLWLGEVRLLEGDLVGANELIESTLKDQRILFIADARWLVAHVALEKGDVEKAEELAHKAIEMARMMDSPHREGFGRAVLVQVYLARGQFVEAEREATLLRAGVMKSQVLQLRLQAEVIWARAHAAAHGAGGLPMAQSVLRKEIAEADRHGLLHEQLLGRLAMEELERHNGRLLVLASEAERFGFGLIASKARRIAESY